MSTDTTKQEEIKTIPEKDKPFYLAILGFGGLMASGGLIAYGAYISNNGVVEAGKYLFVGIIGLTTMMWERYKRPERTQPAK